MAQPMPMQQSTDATCVLTWTREVPQTDKGVLPPPTEDSVKVVKQRLSPKTLRAHEAKMASCDNAGKTKQCPDGHPLVACVSCENAGKNPKNS